MQVTISSDAARAPPRCVPAVNAIFQVMANVSTYGLPLFAYFFVRASFRRRPIKWISTSFDLTPPDYYSHPSLGGSQLGRCLGLESRQIFRTEAVFQFDLLFCLRFDIVVGSLVSGMVVFCQLIPKFGVKSI